MLSVQQVSKPEMPPTLTHPNAEFTEISLAEDGVAADRSAVDCQPKTVTNPTTTITKKTERSAAAAARRWFFVACGLLMLLFGLVTFIVVISLRAPIPTWQRIVYIVLASVLNAIVFFCYFRTMSTAAGSIDIDAWRVPEEYLIRHETGPILGINNDVVKVMPYPVSTRDRSGNVRYCRPCNAVRPDRSHHCNACGECTAKFDHHCPWMGRCIGYRNQKLFYLFTMYGFLLAIFYTATTIAVIVQYFNAGGSAVTPVYVLALDIAILFVSATFGCMFVGALFLQHTYFILSNQTTFEKLRPQQPVAPVPAGTRLYDQGAYKNWTSVMGTNPWLWFVPVRSISGMVYGDGCTYPTPTADMATV